MRPSPKRVIYSVTIMLLGVLPGAHRFKPVPSKSI
jgi:hypothetical protein